MHSLTQMRTHRHTQAILATSATQRKSALLRIKTKGPKALTRRACFFIHPNLFSFLWHSKIFMDSFSFNWQSCCWMKKGNAKLSC